MSSASATLYLRDRSVKTTASFIEEISKSEL